MSGLADLEARLLASIPTAEAFERLALVGIDGDSFATYGPMYSYIREMVEEHGGLPRLRDLKATFNVPDYVQRRPEEFDLLLDDFLKLTIAQKIQSLMDANVDAYADDPSALVHGLINDLGNLVIADQREESITDQRVETRLAEYEELARQQTNAPMRGVPTGLHYFDTNCRIGWMGGELIGLVARTGLGKSWLCLQFGLTAWQTGRRVLFLSPELPQDEAEARWDALLCGMNNVAVDAMDFYRGFHPSKEQVALAARAAKREDWITLCGIEGRAFGLEEIPRLVAKYAPDLVLIDGLDFLRLGGRTRPIWEKVHELSYGLKTIAVNYDVPILVSHQANRGASDTSKPPAIDEIKGGDSFAQAVDRMLVVSRPAYKTRPKELTITVQKFRKGEPEQGGINMMFDPSGGKIHEDLNPKPTGVRRTTGPSVQARPRNAGGLPVP